MANAVQLIETLKKTLKAHGLTYADVAQKTELSEASVKRMFSQRHFTLSRLEQICKMMDMELSDLVEVSNQNSRLISNLTEEQESTIIADLKLLIMTVCLLNRWSVTEILSVYKIDHLEGIQLLAQLDRMKILQLLPKNRVKLLVSRHFSWLPNGPIQRFFQENVQLDFLNSSFEANGEKRLFATGMLSVASNAELIKKIEKLILEFHERHNEDINRPLENKHGMGLLVAIRPWELSDFTKLRRDTKIKPFV